MDLKHNAVFRILEGSDAGLYRVVLVDGPLAVLAAARLDPAEHLLGHKPGRRKSPSTKQPRAKARRLLCSLSWFSHDEIDAYAGRLVSASIKLPSRFHRPVPAAHMEAYERRQRTMADFLNPERLHESVLMHHGWSGLVTEAAKQHGTSRVHVYKLLSGLCQRGFSDQALRPDFPLCGAPGVQRPADPGIRKKSGRRTTAQRLALLTGQALPTDVQPGTTSAWRLRILAADAKIPAPKPAMALRVDMIRLSHFIGSYEEVRGKLVPILGPKGTYPTKQQIKRVLTTDGSKLDRLIQSTTKGHFERSLRGLKGKSWNGVAGPGHTWAIDSTIGDVYLRSSINRAWILGRPVVYVIVDVWSTAVVGFYVCLAGPSWPMAKVALFNACAPLELLTALWGLGPQQCCLSPAPTLCAVLLCDRGEYLSQAASVDGLEARLSLSYAPPYRPDYKGIVEVLHRIQKNAQYFLIPGALDARRKEYELRKYAPWRGALTVREFVQYLTILFTNYNMTADRRHRLDAHMISAEVQPTPAGLWHWGHCMGIGFAREIPVDDLICQWLDPQPGIVTREGVKFAGRIYSPNGTSSGSWTAMARNFGAWNIDVLPYPGSVSRIWTAHHTGDGLLQLNISDHATTSGELTVEEVADAFAIQTLRTPGIAHQEATTRVQALHQTKELVKEAVRLTTEAEARDSGPRPTINEARAIEQSVSSKKKKQPGALQRPTTTVSEAEETYLQTMAKILEASNHE